MANYLNTATKSYKLHVYSAHDTTLLLILNALNLTSSDCLTSLYVNGTTT